MNDEFYNLQNWKIEILTCKIIDIQIDVTNNRVVTRKRKIVISHKQGCHKKNNFFFNKISQTKC